MRRRTALSAEKGARIRLGIRKGNDKGRSTGRGPKYLFSGLLKCGICGANYKVYSSTSYGCGLNLDGGSTACSNGMRLPRKIAEPRLLDALRDDLYSEEACRLFVVETTRLLQAHAAAAKPQLRDAQRESDAADKEIANIVSAIKAGIISPSTKAALEEAEAAKAKAQSFLAEATKMDAGAAKAVATMLPRAMDRYRELLGDLAGALGRDVDQARNQRRQLLGEIRLYPTDKCL